jgi:hypothetical protein
MATVSIRTDDEGARLVVEQQVCVCGEPIEPAPNPADGWRHLDRALDNDHEATPAGADDDAPEVGD